MAASVLTLGLEKEIAGHVKLYFDTFKEIQPSGMKVGGTTHLKGPETLQSMLKGIKDAKNKELVIVIHGFEDGTGLYLKLAHKKAVRVGVDAQFRAIERLNAIASRPNYGKSAEAVITQDDRDILDLENAQIVSLLALMADVRKLQLTDVEFRACNLGKNIVSLNAYRELLGAKNLSAPNLHSFFGERPVGVGQHHLDTHEKAHSGTMYTYTEEFADPKGVFLNCTRVNENNKPKQGHFVATSKEVVTQWVRQHIKDGSEFKGKTVPIHGLWERPTSNSKDPLAFVDAEANRPRPIWPLDTEFDEHIQWAIGVTITHSTFAGGYQYSEPTKAAPKLEFKKVAL